MARLTNARNNYINKWVIPAASQLLVEAACQNTQIRSLSEVAHVEMGHSPSGSSCNNNQEGIPFIGGPGDLGLIFPTITRWTNAPTKLCQPGDIIVCVRATIGEPRWADGVYCIGRGVAAIRPIGKGLDNRFLFHIIEANQQKLIEQGTGTTFKTISKRHLNAIPVPVIPKNEQEAICNFLEWLEQNSSDKVNFSNAPLLPSHLEEQRQIVARVEELAGKVEEARSLRQLTVEKTEAFTNASAAKIFAGLDSADFYQIDAISEVKGGIQKSSVRTPGANPKRYITVAHVQRNSIDTGDPRYFEVSDEELERWRLIAGDVLVIEGNGSPDHIGRAALFRGEIENCVHQNHVIRIRPNTVYITPEYLNTYLNSPVGKDQMLELSRTTSGLYTLSVGRIKSIKIPVPSLPEQRRIVTHLDELQAKVDTMKRLREQAIKELDALLPSILDKAFKGEL